MGKTVGLTKDLIAKRKKEADAKSKAAKKTAKVESSNSENKEV